jgi:5'-nucleotidase
MKQYFRLEPLMAAMAVTGVIVGASAQAAPFDLTIFHNNDGESQLLPFDNGGLAEGGIAQFVGTLNNARAADANIQLTLSSGDNFLPGLVNNGGFNDEALALIDYDAIAIGNHDFDLGPDFLAGFVADYNANGGSAPFLSANLDFSAEASLQALVGSGSIAASTVIEKGGQKFGIIGATTENLSFISSPGGVVVSAAAAAVQAQVDTLTASGVDNIVLISHLQGVAEDQALISQVQGIDVAIAGGGDNLLQNPSKPDADELLPGDDGQGPYPTIVKDKLDNDVVVVTTAGGYDYIGKLTVTFDGSGKVTGFDTTSGPIRVYQGDALVTEDPVAKVLQDDVQAYTETAEGLVIATYEPVLDARADTVRSVEANIGNLVADALRSAATGQTYGDEVLIALMNGGGIRTDTVYDSGEFTVKNALDILPFGNTLAVVEDVTVQQLVDTLENAVSRVVAVDGKPERQGGGTGRFAQVSGIEFEYSLTNPALELDADGNVVSPGSRILSVRLADDLGGTLLYDATGGVLSDILLDIATLSFTANGGDQYFHSFDQNVTLLSQLDSDLLIGYISGVLGGEITAAMYPVGGNGRISYVPVVPTIALFGLGVLGLALRRRG